MKDRKFAELLILIAKIVGALIFVAAVFWIAFSRSRPHARVNGNISLEGVQQPAEQLNHPELAGPSSDDNVVTGEAGGGVSQLAVPVNQIGPSLKGSFTELFSGNGWVNKAKTNIYQDVKTTIISFPPAYTTDEMTVFGGALQGENIVAADGNGSSVVLLSDSGNIFEIKNDNTITKSGSAGAISSSATEALDYDDPNGTWVVVVSSGGTVRIIAGERNASLSASGAVNDLACARGECLLAVDSSLYVFPSSNPSAVRRVDYPDGASSVSLGKDNDSLLVGITRKDKDDKYYSTIYTYGDSGLSKAAGNMFLSSYPGRIRFGYNSGNDEIFTLYDAYIGQAEKFKAGILSHSPLSLSASSSLYADYSRFFQQRVLGGESRGIISSDVNVFYKDGAWWAGSSDKSSKPKLVRVEGGLGSDMTDLVTASLSFSGKLLFAPAAGSRQIYVIAPEQGSTKIYRLTDAGFDTKTKMSWESSKVNFWEGNITGATITTLTGGDYTEGVSYYLSANGGKDWIEAKPLLPMEFRKSFLGFYTDVSGDDLRFRIDFSPLAASSQSPWVDIIEVDYSGKDSRPAAN